jgi:tRNA (guanine-N7-)-methyltransferase
MVRVRQHVNPLKSQFLAARTARAPIPAGADEIEVELGCAEAQFLFERAEIVPASTALIGLEIRHELVDAVNARGGRVRAVFTNVNVDLPYLFASASVARFFVNFPDPWFKKRQHKRRVMEPALADGIAAALRPGGELLFQSDVWELALDALDVLEGCSSLTNMAGAWSFWKGRHPFGVRSRREEQCDREGLPVWRLLYRR